VLLVACVSFGRDLVAYNNSPSAASSQGLQAALHKWQHWPQRAEQGQACSSEPEPEWWAGNGTVFGRSQSSNITQGGRRPCWRIEGAVERSLRKIVYDLLGGIHN
jgi:hypothetical protein